MLDTKECDLTININSTVKNSPISPPTPLTPSFASNKSSNASMYSLFDSSASSSSSSLSPWDWLPANNTPISRNHSIDIDGKDLSTKTGGKSTTADYWRRASAPNVMNYADNVCTYCLNKNTQLISPSCGQHHFCHSCLTSQSTQLLLQGSCPFCTQVTLLLCMLLLFVNPFCTQTSTTNMDTASQINAAPFISNGATYDHYANGRTNVTNYYACVKLTNVCIQSF